MTALLPKIRLQLWPNEWAAEQTDGEVHIYNAFETACMLIKIERLMVLEERCLQNFV